VHLVINQVMQLQVVHHTGDLAVEGFAGAAIVQGHLGFDSLKPIFSAASPLG
jgi:hypothetical protein